MSARQNGLRCYSKRYYYSHLYIRYLSRQKSDILFSSTSVKEFELIALCIPLLFPYTLQLHSVGVTVA